MGFQILLLIAVKGSKRILLIGKHREKEKGTLDKQTKIPLARDCEIRWRKKHFPAL
jgi:hypothetical protein